MATQASGWIAFLGVVRCHDMAGGRLYRFAGLVRIWTKTGLFLVQKRNETPETPETLGTPETLSVDVRIVVL